MKLQDVLQSPLSMIISARRFSGKTFLIKELLNSPEIKKKYDEIYVFSATGALDKTWEEVKNKNVFIESEYSTKKLTDLLESLKEDFIDGERNKVLIIVDDLMREYNSKKSSVFEYLASTGRHYLVDYIFTTQKYNKMTPTMRLNSTTKMFFKISNNQEMEVINKELSQRHLKTTNIEELIDNNTKEHYNYFLMVDGLDMKYYTGKGLEVKEVEIKE